MTAGSSQPVNVLVVDDRPENRLALRAILSSSAYRILEAGSGPEALLHLLSADVAVLLVDVVMPGMSGFELAAAIKQRERTAAVPIVFLTAEASDVDMVYKGYRAGAVDYLVKPLVPEMVRAKVAVFAELYRQRRRIEEQGALLVDAEKRESEHRLVELRLAGERRYRNLAEAVPHVIWTALPDGTLTYFNQQWFAYTGLSAEETTAGWTTALHPDDRPAWDTAWNEANRTGRSSQVELRLRRADASYHWHLARAVPERGGAGEVVSWVGTFTDIEDQKRVQAVLAEFKGTMDAVSEAVLIFEPESLALRYVNQSACGLLGHREDELLRLRPVDLVAGIDEDGFRELLARLRDGARAGITLEARFRRRDGRQVPVELSFQLVEVDGDHVVAIARDITERKLAELERDHLYREALAAIQARDEFLSVASHELRTPLSSLQLQLEMLTRLSRRGPDVPESVREKLDVAMRQVDRLSRLVSELMDVSKIGAGRLQLELEPVDLAALVEDVASRFKVEAARTGSALTTRTSGAVTGRWDRLRMEQVVTNLVANALKFGAGRPIEVVVASDPPLARLVVRDEGIGIAAEDVERIFGRFERAASARRYGGLGLGLYIVRQIVDAHRGTIRVESQPGAGATFTVEVPLEPPRVAPPPESERTPSETGVRG